MKTLLLTGFEPFGGEVCNPSAEVAERLAGELGDWRIISLILPVSYRHSFELLRSAIEREHPDAVICLGQAGGRMAVTPEAVAINRMDAALPDNDGVTYIDAPIIEGAPNAYFTTLPVKAMVRAIEQKGIPTALSYTAGTYVCNCLMYSLLNLLETEYSAVIGGFIHLPYSSEQVAGREPLPNALPMSDLVRAVECCIRTL